MNYFKENKLLYIMLSLVVLYTQGSIFSFYTYNKKIIFQVAIYIMFLYCIVVGFKNKNEKNKSLISFIFLLFYFFHSGVKVLIFNIFISICIIKIKKKDYLYIVFYKTLAVLCFLSLISYICILNNVSLDLERVESNNILKVESGIYYLKHYFVSVAVNNKNIIFQRFQSFFGEPGELGTLIGLLFLFDYNFKIMRKERCILFISGLLSLSTAFYILFILKIIAYPLKGIKKLKIILLFSFILTMVIWILKIEYPFLYNRSFNKIIVSLKTNTRESQEVQKILDTFMKTPKSIFGVGTQFNNDYQGLDVSSWRVIIYEKGYFSFGLLILYLLYISNFNKRNFNSKIAILFFLLSVYQRPGILSCANLLILSCGSSFNYKNINNRIIGE